MFKSLLWQAAHGHSMQQDLLATTPTNQDVEWETSSMQNHIKKSAKQRDNKR